MLKVTELLALALLLASGLLLPADVQADGFHFSVGTSRGRAAPRPAPRPAQRSRLSQSVDTPRKAKPPREPSPRKNPAVASDSHSVVESGAPPGSALAAAPRPVATESEAPARDESWLQELPSVEQVRSTIHGTSPVDTVARQDAAFEMLDGYIIARAGLSSRDVWAPANIEKLRIGYLRAQTSRVRGGNPDAGMTPEASAYMTKDLETYLGMLSALLPRQAIAAYRATPHFRALSEQLDAHAALRAYSAEKQGSKLDLNAFGIPLYEPLRLPACPEGLGAAAISEYLGVGRGAAETCVGDAVGAMAQAMANFAKAAVGGQAQQSKIAWVAVRLQNEKCPAWMKAGGSCVLLVATQHGVTLGVKAPSGVSGAAYTMIVNQVSAKYGTRPANGTKGMRCVSRREGVLRTDTVVVSDTQELVWQPEGTQGLRISYIPVSADCAHGNVSVDTPALRNAQLEDQRRREVSEAKM